MIEMTLVIEDEKEVAGAGPGGTTKAMRKVTLDGELVGYIAHQRYQIEGGIFEAYIEDTQTPLMRNPSMEVLALELCARRRRQSSVRQGRALT